MRVLLFLLLFAGCAPNSGLLSPQVQTQEAATDIRVHRVGAVQSICMRLVGGFDLFLGCYYRSGATCDIFLSEHSPKFVEDHERKHCAGYIH